MENYAINETQSATPTSQPQVSVLSAVTAIDYEAQKQAEADAKAKAMAGDQIKPNLLSFLDRCKTEAINAKQLSGVSDKLLDAQRRRNNQHSAEKIAQLKKYNLPNYWVPLTQTKCIHTEAWMRDILMPYRDKTWKIEPTEIPEIQGDDKEAILQGIMAEAQEFMMQGGMVSDDQIHKVREQIEEKYRLAMLEDAKEKATNMERLINDQLEECGWKAIFKQFQTNLTTYGTAFIRGPYTKTIKAPKWDGMKRVVVDKVIPTCSSPSPHDIFPAPWATSENDGYVIERIKTYREGLNSVKDLPYYNKKEIVAFLMENQAGTNSTVQYGDQQRAENENKSQTPPDNRLELWLWNGSVAGYMLKEWGLDGCDETEDYNVEVLWGGSHILRVMPMWDRAGVKPIFRAVFKETPNSFWGIGVPLLMSASQDRANMMMIAMLDNANWGTGFIGWIDTTRVVNLDDIKEMYSKKWIPTHSSVGNSGAPMGLMDIPLRVAELDSLYQKCLQDADNESGVPAYMYGSGGGGGAAGTYSGLQTLMNASARGIKDGLLAIDDAVSRFIAHWADWNLEYSEDESVKGDIRVVCSGATGLFVVEMEIDKLDNLIAQANAYLPITGPEWIIGMLRQKAKHLKVDVSKLPTDDQIAMRMSENAGKESKDSQAKASMSISVNWETLTPEEKLMFRNLVPAMNQDGKEQAEGKAEEEAGIEGQMMPPTSTTGTPAQPDLDAGQQMANGRVKPMPRVNQ